MKGMGGKLLEVGGREMSVGVLSAVLVDPRMKVDGGCGILLDDEAGMGSCTLGWGRESGAGGTFL